MKIVNKHVKYESCNNTFLKNDVYFLKERFLIFHWKDFSFFT